MYGDATERSDPRWDSIHKEAALSVVRMSQQLSFISISQGISQRVAVVRTYWYDKESLGSVHKYQKCKTDLCYSTNSKTSRMVHKSLQKKLTMADQS